MLFVHRQPILSREIEPWKTSWIATMEQCHVYFYLDNLYWQNITAMVKKNGHKVKSYAVLVM